jgi:Ca2+-binding RTX toxin-like protein
MMARDGKRNIGTSGADDLSANPPPGSPLEPVPTGEILIGHGGNDILRGNSGEDVLFGDTVFARNAALQGVRDHAIIYSGNGYTESALQQNNHDLLIINSARVIINAGPNHSETLWTAAQIANIGSNGKLVIGYLDLTKINDYVGFWNESWTSNGLATGALTGAAPSWLGAIDTADTRLINLDDPNWVAGVTPLFKARIAEMIGQGFDGIFFDDVVRYFVDQNVPLSQNNAREVRDLIIDLAEYARDLVRSTQGAAAADRFAIIVNGAPSIVIDSLSDPATAARYYNAIDAILAENYLSTNNQNGISRALADFASQGILTLSADTGIAAGAAQTALEQRGEANGFIPTTVSGPNYDGDTTRYTPILGAQNGNDTLFGGGGNDRLAGGLGNDMMHGGAGNDIYYFDDSGDLAFEDANGGTDEVVATVGAYLHANVENLTLSVRAGNIFGVGNALGNIITGNEGQNLLIAGGGNDTVRGGGARDSIFGEGGDDQLFGDAGIDYIVGGLGNDTIDGGIDADEIYGEDGNDTLTGGAGFSTDILVGGLGNDILRGDSGLGDYDLLYGNVGDDSFYVDTPDDLVFEQAGQGTDTVHANINGAGYYLYDNIENLTLAGTTPFGVGNALANTITGNASVNYLLGGGGNDRLNGKGGADVLFGEAGADVFIFDRGTGGDVIGDFQRGTDDIDLSAFGFTSFAQLQARFVQDGSVGGIVLGNGDVIVLHNVQMSQLAATDFIL